MEMGMEMEMVKSSEKQSNADQEMEGREEASKQVKNHWVDVI